MNWSLESALTRAFRPVAVLVNGVLDAVWPMDRNLTSCCCDHGPYYICTPCAREDHERCERMADLLAEAEEAEEDTPFEGYMFPARPDALRCGGMTFETFPADRLTAGVDSSAGVSAPATAPPAERTDEPTMSTFLLDCIREALIEVVVTTTVGSISTAEAERLVTEFLNQPASQHK